VYRGSEVREQGLPQVDLEYGERRSVALQVREKEEESEDNLRQFAGFRNSLEASSPGCVFELEVQSIEIENSIGRIKANDGKKQFERFDKMGAVG
jgi:hypothetical protein